MVFGSVVLLSACQQEEHDPALVTVHTQMTTALIAADKETLYALSSADLHTRLEDFHSRWDQTVQRVRAEYPESEREKALKQLAADVSEKVGNGKELFVHLLSLNEDLTDGLVQQGLDIAELVLNGDRAVVTTKAGEVFEYRNENGQWRSTLLLNQWESYASVKMLENNIRTANANLDSWRVASRETTDQKKPEGAFNTIIQAVQKGYRMTVYTVLSAETIRLLNDGAKSATALRKKLKKQMPKEPERREFLVKRKIDWSTRVTDGRSLFAILWDTGRLKMDLKIASDTKVKSVIPSDTDPMRVSIVTGSKAGDEQFEMIRQADSSWKLTSLETAIKAKAVGPIRGALAELATPSAPTVTKP